MSIEHLLKGIASGDIKFSYTVQKSVMRTEPDANGNGKFVCECDKIKFEVEFPKFKKSRGF